jgi:hypothetical protein
MRLKSISLLLLLICLSCGSIKSTLKNIDDNAPTPELTKNNTFVLTQLSTDKKYGYNKDYPINVFYKNTKDEDLNSKRFLNALAGPKGEKIFYKKLESCCPFPNKRSEMGAGFLDVYEITWVGLQRPFKLYLNIYDKGVLMVPVGFTAKKFN